MKKYVLPSFFLLLILFGFVAIFALRNNTEDNNKLTVVTTFYPPADFVNQIGGDKVEVINLTSGGVEPHGYEPSPQDLVNIQNSDLFIINGNGLDNWAEKFAGENNEVNSLLLSDEVDSIEGEEHNHNGEDEHSEEENEYDPHFWLDPIRSIKLVEAISESIIELDSENKEFYEQNAIQYIAELNKLDREFKNGLESCSQRKIVVAHDAFTYLANRYSFETISISGLSPEEEPTANTMIEISKIVRENDIKYIFYETLVSPDLANTIANETNASTLVLNPVAGLTSEELSDGENYVSIMRNNLNNLRIAMECK